MRADMGLDLPLLAQCARYLGQTVQFNLARSIKTHQRMAELIGERIMPTLLLTVFAMLWSVIVGIGIDVLSGVKRGGAEAYARCAGGAQHRRACAVADADAVPYPAGHVAERDRVLLAPGGHFDPDRRGAELHRVGRVTAERGMRAMLAERRGYLGVADQITLFPGPAIFITVLAFNLLGDGLRDALDQKLRREKVHHKDTKRSFSLRVFVSLW